MSNSCATCKHSDVFFGILSCVNKKTMKTKGSIWGDSYVNNYGWNTKLCKRHKKDSR